ncbi:early nodulin-75 isoform X1 [Cryptomeria japonica]|uniref:early nodulin-75 isoform X1 n=1 Tax=Cryptomeria japonica TaxID=3369 RepID=UPI0025AB6715|nr:early nodulin-75 isoform X1 [Cryptomeria japonica]
MDDPTADPDFEEDADSPEYLLPPQIPDTQPQTECVQRPPPQNPSTDPQTQYVQPPTAQNPYTAPQTQYHVPQNPCNDPQIQHVQPPLSQNLYADLQVRYVQSSASQDPYMEPREQYVQRPPSQNPHDEPQVQHVQRRPQQNFHAEPHHMQHVQPPQPQVQHVQRRPPPQNPHAQSHVHYMQNPHAEPQVQYVQPLPTQNPHAEPQVQYVQPPPRNPNVQFGNVIYVQAPPHASLQQGGHNIPALWASSLYSCTEDPANCCLTLLCPCITFGQIAEIVDENSPCWMVELVATCIVSGRIHGLLCLAGIAFSAFFGLPLFWGFAWCYSCTHRNKMRVKYNLAETPCADCLVHSFVSHARCARNIKSSNIEDMTLLSVMHLYDQM